MITSSEDLYSVLLAYSRHVHCDICTRHSVMPSRNSTVSVDRSTSPTWRAFEIISVSSRLSARAAVPLLSMEMLRISRRCWRLGGQAIYLQGGMDDALMGAVPLIPTSVPLSSRKSAEPSGLNSAFSEHLSQ